MKSRLSPARLTSLVVLLLAAIVAMVSGSAAAVVGERPTAISIGQLQGPWAASLNIGVDCGNGTAYTTFRLSATGTGSGTIKLHSTGSCGASHRVVFTILSLNRNGSGTAFIGCGPDCQWNFAIQVSRNLQEMSLVDITDPNQFVEGVAIRQ